MIWYYSCNNHLSSNKFMKNLKVFRSIWALNVPLTRLYSMFLTCFRVPRSIRTGLRSVILAMENVLIEMTRYIYSGIERESSEDVRRIYLGFMGFY